MWTAKNIQEVVSQTGEHEAVAGARLLRQCEQEPEDAANAVEGLQGETDRLGHPTHGRVRSPVCRNNVGVQVNVIDCRPVDTAGNFSTDALRLICKSNTIS